MSEGSFRLGESVQLKGQPSERGHIIEGPRQGADGLNYKVAFNQRVAWVSARQLELSSLERMGWVKKRRFLRDLAVLKLLDPLSDVLYSIGASRTEFLVYQFQPVLKFVQSLPHGILIADEVGLGKTIEAGLILKELVARGAVRRVLVLCPANLREKWRMEMQQRFGLEFRPIGTQDIRTIRRDVEKGEWPDFFGIASLEGLRRDELREILQETGIQFDLVIVDEAHHLRNPQTLSFDLGEILSDQADHILLLSATPVQTGAQDLLSLLRLIEPGQFRGTSASELDELLEPNAHLNRALAALSQSDVNGPSIANELRRVLQTSLARAFEANRLFQACLTRLEQTHTLSPDTIAEVRRDLQRLHTLAPYFTRTRKREVQETAKRNSRTMRVRLTEEEAVFYDALVRYLVALAQSKHPGAPVTWVISMRERQAASSLQAAKETLEGLLANQAPDDVETSDPGLVWRTSSGSRTTALSTLSQERETVVKAAEQLSTTDTKADQLIDVLQQLQRAKPGRKVLLFSFFKGTLRHLSRRLRAASIRHYVMSGDDPPAKRADIVANFQDDREALVLLSTEVGSEGLDFQFCDAVINYDLPWNPMRVEQRIGRIDRFGQREPVVQVVSFFVEDTIDTRILERLYDRIHVFEQSIGELEPILGPEVQHLQSEVFSTEFSAEELQQRTDEAIRRIEILRLQYEEFEAARSELMGHGDLIRQQVELTKSSGRYLTPSELEAIVAEWLEASAYAFESIQPTRHAGVLNLRLSSESIGRVFEWMGRQQRRDPLAKRLLDRIHQDGHSWCTFDSEIARTFDNLPFIDIGHPLIRVALDDARRNPPSNAFERVGCLRLTGEPGWPARFALFLYRLVISGAEPQSTLVPVAVDMASGEVRDGIGDQVLGSLSEAEDAGPFPDVDIDTLEILEQVAFEHADRHRATIEQWSADTQHARVATKKATLERNYQARIDRKEETLRRLLTRGTDPRIQRLHEGEIRNLRAALDAKLAELDSLPLPVATLDLMAVGLVESGAPGEHLKAE